MPDTVIIKPEITPDEKLKRLDNIAEILTRITGLKCEYIGTDHDSKVKKTARYKRNAVKSGTDE